MTKQPHPAYLLLGQVLRPHGVRGELRVLVLTDYPERIATLTTVFLGADPEDDAPIPYELESVRFHQAYALIKLRDIPDRTEAERLRDKFLMIDIDHAVPLAEDEFYLYQLLDLTVRTHDGQTLGVVVDVLETGANDVYVVESPTYGELLIPAHAETLVEIDLDAGIITMNLPDGLLPPPPAR